MGLFDEIKKAVWAAKSVGKNAGKNATGKVREAGNDLNDEMQNIGDQMVQGGKDAFNAAKEFIEDAQASINKPKDESSDFVDMDGHGPKSANTNTTDSFQKAGEKLGEAVDKAKKAAQPYVDSAKKAAEPYMEKAMDFTEEVGKEVLDKGDKVANKAADVAEALGEKVLEFGGILKDQAEEVGSQLAEKGKAFFDKAQEEAAKEKATSDLIDKAVEEQKAKDHQRMLDEMAKKAEGMNKTGNDALDKLKTAPGMDGFDDFFDRASRFADGDYHNKGKEPKKDVSIDTSGKTNRPDTSGKLSNFKDNDGDGNELIDDAIIEE